MTEPVNSKRLEWQCRRGMLELDVMLIPFLKQFFEDLPHSQQQSFEELLTYADPDIYTWIMGFGECEHQTLHEIIALIRTNMKIA